MLLLISIAIRANQNTSSLYILMTLVIERQYSPDAIISGPAVISQHGFLSMRSEDIERTFRP